MTTSILDEIKMNVADLAGVEPRSIASDRDAKEAATWLEMQKRAEAEAEEILGPAIKVAFARHKELTGEKKTLLEKLLAAKDRVRGGLANWIGAGHSVAGCYVKTKYKVTVTDASQLPGEYLLTIPDMPQLENFIALTEGSVPVPGCLIEKVHVLYAKETK